MIKSLRHAARRPISAMLLLCMVVLMFALAACGGDAPAAGGTGAAAMTVTIKESKDAAGADVYACDPTTLTVTKGSSVTFTNMSDEKQTFTGAGDAQKAGVTLDLAINASSTVTFGTAGTFMLESGKKATITVTVQ